jgi:hypothetical protein
VVVGATFLFTTIGTAFAQSEYPSAASRRAGLGAYGQFDLQGGETQTIVDLEESASYRVCIVGKSSTVVVDGTKKNGLDHGDCYDVQGKKIDVQSDDGEGDTHGVYERLFPGSVVNRGG